ncbi:MAG: hypothetical protein IJ313_04275 [Clostridia bacterium]|nr:hypothetical protein [Clostridia bacterium]
MKKLLCMLIALLLISAGASAEEYVTLSELRTQVGDGWHKTYQAHGREVVANAGSPWMPESGVCPIVEVEGIGFEEDDERFDVYRALPDTVVYPNTCALSIDVLGWDNMFYYPLGAYMGKILYEDHSYFNGETPQVLPENSDLDYDAFLARVEDDLYRLTGFHLSDFHIQEVETTTCEYKAKKINGELVNGDPLTKAGFWHLDAQQLFHGIPVVENFVDPTVPGGLINYNYGVPDRFHFQFKCMRETRVIEEDVPLLAYNAFIGKLEELVNAGKLRGVDEISFGYLPYVSENTHVLLPTWRIVGGYHKDPNYSKAVMPYETKDGDTFYPSAYGEYYFNAQTGDMIDMPKNERNDALLPAAYDVLTWDDVK